MRLLNHLFALNAIAGPPTEQRFSDEVSPFERRQKAITKGDPREFMG